MVSDINEKVEESSGGNTTALDSPPKKYWNGIPEPDMVPIPPKQQDSNIEEPELVPIPFFSTDELVDMEDKSLPTMTDGALKDLEERLQKTAKNSVEDQMILEAIKREQNRRTTSQEPAAEPAVKSSTKPAVKSSTKPSFHDY